ncbi:MAG: CDP-diacylglycerol--serine O-phosphatidyltransferase [Bacteroidales bacterium]|nr:CDP-diacylglycerol--serine O-phosphatidyltransferase [Bacteroidales bacterium]
MALKKHIPNAITSLNLLCGVIGIVLYFKNNDLAFAAMLAAVAFDFCDGLAARLLGVISPRGKELDSLADVVSFGVLPAIMMAGMADYLYQGGPWRWLCAIPLLIAVFSALRLSKFNLDERQHESFIGLPTPASALICGALCCIAPESTPFWVFPAVAAVLCFLLVCELPMFSFKFGKDMKADVATRMLRYAIISISIIIIVLVILLRLPWPAIILGVLLAYILENALYCLFKPKA